MNKHAPIQLDEHFTKFVEERVTDGQYESPSAVVKAALQLMEDDAQKLEALRAALIEGEESGFIEFDFDEFIAAKRSK
jgi:antitoxin ParD1/3/4